MKHIHSVKAILILSGLLLLLVGCDRMNDIQEKYASQEERVYLAKPQPLRYSPGVGRVKLVWSNGTDMRIDNTVIYWNDRKDSIVKPVSMTSTAAYEDSVTVEGLPEGSLTFEFKNKNSRGDCSLTTTMPVTIWGPNFVGRELTPRRIDAHIYSFLTAEFSIDLSTCMPNDHVAYSHFRYTDKSGEEKVVKVDRGVDHVVLEGFPEAGELFLTSTFFIDSGIDSLYSEAVSVKSPEAIHSSGKRIDVGNGFSSKYYNREGALYEWLENGAFNIWTVSDGEFTLSQTTGEIASRSVYREFFHYGSDRFIGVTIDNSNLNMFQWVSSDTPSVNLIAGSFGSKFKFDYFIPMNGYFLSLNSIAGGSLLYWPVRNDGSWPSSIGTSRSSSFHYPLITVWHKESLVVVDNDGFLWLIPTSSSGVLGTPRNIGQGWNKFSSLLLVGDYMLAMDAEGAFHQFHFDLDHYWIVD